MSANPPQMWHLPDDPACGNPHGAAIEDHNRFWARLSTDDRAAAASFIQAVGRHIALLNVNPEVLAMAMANMAGGMFGALTPGDHRDRSLDLAIRVLRGGAQRGALPGSGIAYTQRQTGRA